MQTKQNHKHWTLRIAAVLLCLVLFTTQLMSGMLARYSTASGESDQARAAAFAFSVKDAAGTFQMDLSDINYPGAFKEYEFTVSNKNGSVSEVAESVSATMTPGGELPLKITLNMGSETLIEIDMAVSREEKSRANFLVFPAEEEKQATLTLHVEWPAGYNSTELCDKTAALNLSLTAEQVD